MFFGILLFFILLYLDQNASIFTVSGGIQYFPQQAHSTSRGLKLQKADNSHYLPESPSYTGT